MVDIDEQRTRPGPGIAVVWPDEQRELVRQRLERIRDLHADGGAA